MTLVVKRGTRQITLQLLREKSIFNIVRVYDPVPVYDGLPADEKDRVYDQLFTLQTRPEGNFSL